MNKKRIDIYKTIWDIDIVVANKYTTLEDLKETYTYSDDKELDDFIVDGCGTTSTVKNKKTKALCCLVKYNRRITRKDYDGLLDTINTAVHEAVHCCLDIYSNCHVHIHYDNQEPVAYEIANITTNILKTILNK
jgi:hypothetical protein